MKIPNEEIISALKSPSEDPEFKSDLESEKLEKGDSIIKIPYEAHNKVKQNSGKFYKEIKNLNLNNEFKANDVNNQSIPIPKINPRFKDCFSRSDSEYSDNEDQIKSIKMKYKAVN